MTKARDLAGAANSAVNSTEIGYLDGVTSSVQTQLDAKIAKSLTTTTGDIIYASSANTPARLGIGSTNQVLTVSDGVPSWNTASSGYTQLDSGSLSGSVTTISSISGSYRDLILIIRNFQTTASSSYGLRINDDTNTSSYRGLWLREASGTAGTGVIGSNGFIQGNFGPAIITGDNKNTTVWTVNNYADTSSYKTVTASTYLVTSGPTEYSGFTNGVYKSTAAVTSLSFVNSSSTWSGGTYTLYGVK